MLLRSMVKNQEVWGMVFYFVQKGETLYAIAKQYQITVHAIVTANRLEDPNAIRPGQALIIPRPGEVPSPPPGGIVHVVHPGETIFHLADKFGATPREILRANQIAHPEFLVPGQQLVIPERAEAGEDWPMLGRTPGRAAASPVELQGLPIEGWGYTPRKNLGIHPSAPVIRYNRVYVGLGDGHFYSLDRGTGRVKWQIPVGEPESAPQVGEWPLAAPAVLDGLAYLCGPDGTVLAVDAYTGQSIWKVVLGGPITSSPTASLGLICLGCWNGHLYALESKTGAIAWDVNLGGPVELPAAVGDNRVLAVTADGTAWMVDIQSGEICWKAPTIPRMPVFAEVLILVGDRAYDPESGQLLWRVDASGAIPTTRLDQVIYPGGVVDLFSGHLRRPQGDSVQTEGSEPKGAEPQATSSGDNGMTRVPMPDIPICCHIVSGPLVIAVGNDERLYGWGAHDGRLTWAKNLPVACHQPPAVSPGQLVLSMADGTLRTYRFKGSGQET